MRAIRRSDARQRADYRQGARVRPIEPAKIADVIVVPGNLLFDIVAYRTSRL